MCRGNRFVEMNPYSLWVISPQGGRLKAEITPVSPCRGPLPRDPAGPEVSLCSTHQTRPRLPSSVS